MCTQKHTCASERAAECHRYHHLENFLYVYILAYSDIAHVFKGFTFETLVPYPPCQLFLFAIMLS